MVSAGAVAFSMATPLGYFKLGVLALAFIGPPSMAVWAGVRGWKGGIEAISERRGEPMWQFEQYLAWQRLGGLPMEEMEALYLRQMQLGGEDAVKASGGFPRLINGHVEANKQDGEVDNFSSYHLPLQKEFFYRLKVRLMTAESDVPKLLAGQVDSRLKESLAQLDLKKRSSETDTWRRKLWA
mmetsp:Transcript_43542/g.79267  ORF Transcript_43542/g.79267 Transcript_43542/m.79267 type:complete len:183 (+) Transcript_43542:87-635(+)